ncbi:glycosyltransferase [Paenibacillus vini]|uniref:Glycosyltransferase n=1 Tax=Paenibacillus vini TaxID=1476024 RepID=A0ABQ4M6J7_9BACL|nr:glycosyltransferase [Paenibacillus vini]GIP51621.1 putative glycosyltransferase [Paenibacillus vini]
MTYSDPLVSIIIPVFNGSNFLQEAIDSALNQTYPNIEIIVVNDGSNDNQLTEKIALSYKNRIQYYYKENGGVGSALNFGINKMKGDYFSWLSHDDLYTPQKVESQMSILKNHEDKTLIVTGGYKVIDKFKNYQYDVNPISKYSKEKLEGSPLFALMRGAIHGCSTLIHKSHFQKVGVFRTDLPTTQDYDFFFRLLRGERIIFQEGLYVLSREHEEQGSKRIKSHVNECNQLWIGFLDNTSHEEKIKMSGSAFLFYKDTWVFLKTERPYYTKAVDYAKSRAIKEARQYQMLHGDGALNSEEAHFLSTFES